MIELNDICIDYNEILKTALIKIDKNAQGLVFVVDNYKLLGVLTDGDIRRALISGKKIEEKIFDIYNKECVFLKENSSVEIIQRTLNEKIRVIPLIDSDGNVVDFSSVSRLHQYSVLEPLLQGNELEYITDCIKSNWISSQGKYVQNFEDKVREYTGSKYALAVSNGTVALHLALVSLGIGTGDEVIVPDLTFGATLNAVILSGAKPVIIDVDEKTWNLSVDLLSKYVTRKTRAIMPVHIYGVPCDMPAIMEVARSNNLLVIEDCAEALGSSIDGMHVGTFGNIGTFSFFGNKVITCGEGGALIFDDEEVYNKAKILRDHGMSPGKRYWHDVVGFNYRITNLQAAIGCAQFEQLSGFRAKRKEIFSWYEKYLLKSGYFEVQDLGHKYESSYWLFTVKIKNSELIGRDGLIAKLSKFGIDTRPVFFPMSDMPAFKDCSAHLIGNSKAISGLGISLPTSVYLREEDIMRISNEVINCIRSSLNFKKAESNV